MPASIVHEDELTIAFVYPQDLSRMLINGLEKKLPPGCANICSDLLMTAALDDGRNF